MTIDEIKQNVPYESVLETLCVTAYNGTMYATGMQNPMAIVFWPSWGELAPDKQERFRQSVYMSLPRAGNVNALEKLLKGPDAVEP